MQEELTTSFISCIISFMTVEGGPTVPAPREPAHQPVRPLAQDSMSLLGEDYGKILSAPGRLGHRIGKVLTQHNPLRRASRSK
jgi:hypothetical protein